MNIKEMKEMIQLMNENNLTEIELEKDGLKVRLKKGSSGSVEQQIVYHERPAPRLHEAAPEAAKPAAAASKAVMVKSPMVGTYYSAPAPDAPPFLQVGSQVEVGQVICIIEAMKLMNEIESELNGTIIDILVENGKSVEFGQKLFKLKKG
jgi:acetyl-CoA carboxylase biotin carboxyl carrier protein